MATIKEAKGVVQSRMCLSLRLGRADRALVITYSTNCVKDSLGNTGCCPIGRTCRGLAPSPTSDTWSYSTPSATYTRSTSSSVSVGTPDFITTTSSTTRRTTSSTTTSTQTTPAGGLPGNPVILSGGRRRVEILLRESVIVTVWSAMVLLFV